MLVEVSSTLFRLARRVTLTGNHALSAKSEFKDLLTEKGETHLVMCRKMDTHWLEAELKPNLRQFGDRDFEIQSDCAIAAESTLGGDLREVHADIHLDRIQFDQGDLNIIEAEIQIPVKLQARTGRSVYINVGVHDQLRALIPHIPGDDFADSASDRSMSIEMIPNVSILANKYDKE